jgi:hypothetical protein
MYLNVKYPKADVFERWYFHVKGLEPRTLKRGIPFDEFLIKGGASGYKVSVWYQDARAFLTDEVDEKRGEGHGMGIWLQLGPKFLIQNGQNLKNAVKYFLEAIGVIGEYETRITRIDIAMDLFGVSMRDQDLDNWRNNWVGRSKVSSNHFDSKTGALQTINIGSRQSPIYVRIYDKRAQAIKDDDIFFWLDVWGGVDDEVTRIEWEVKPNDGNFENYLKNFSMFNGFAARELLNYLLDWGRLAEPDLSDENRSRWPDSEFWQGLREVAAQWANGVDWPILRHPHTIKPLSEAYVKQAAGVLAGAMARCNPQNPNWVDMLHEFEHYGNGIETLKYKARAKSEILIRSA